MEWQRVERELSCKLPMGRNLSCSSIITEVEGAMLGPPEPVVIFATMLVGWNSLR